MTPSERAYINDDSGPERGMVESENGKAACVKGGIR